MLNRPTHLLLGLVLLLCRTAGAEIQPDFLMEVDPAIIPAPKVPVFKLDFKSLWMQALERPDADLQRMTAETIAQAHQTGVPDLIETVPLLEKILLTETSHLTARFAAARALISLDSRSSAAKLLEATQKYGSELRQLVEPVLAEWDFLPVRAVWIARLANSKTRPRDLILALRGLGQVHEESSLPALLKMTSDSILESHLRLEAATAAGMLVDQGLEGDAERFIKEPRLRQMIPRHCAVRLLHRHSSTQARQLLAELAGDAEPSIAAYALERLNAIDPALVLPLAEPALSNADVHVRTEGAIAYYRLPTTERIRSLAPLLADPHPKLRRLVCQEFVRLSENPDFLETIRDASKNVLAGDRWEGQEQAGLLFGALEYQPVAGRLIELLESTRPEVMISSGWALRKLAEPSSIPAMVDKIQRQTAARKLQGKEGIDEQVAHLFEACGRMRAKEAEPLMFEYVPKALIMGELSRGAAIWALGRLHEGAPDEKTGKALIDRVMDMGIYPPETERVKQQSIISLARIKAVEHLPAMRTLIAKETINRRIDLAIIWANEQLTGEVLPPPPIDLFSPGNWFLTPLAPAETSAQ